MIWTGKTDSGLKMLLIFIEEGVKISQLVYLDMLKDKDYPWVDSETGPNGITFQQDGAISHTAI